MLFTKIFLPFLQSTTETMDRYRFQSVGWPHSQQYAWRGEIWEAIKKLEGGMAPGIDGIIAEDMLKYGRDVN